ncbi:YdcF family protein [Lysobacter sp. H21R4]|uniref:YdcF family protein n=1 Tax=Lysobacter sp. H21R4 TaxID=2781021 RepID=UPI001888522A|nr:YdcF family protein [Lysobacter sp. H21R4]QOY61984.1 YdcF family protein [Lysobacter sp. H21R4]
MTYLLYSPLSWVLLIAGGLLLVWTRLGRRGRAVGIGVWVLAMVLLTPWGGNALIRHVESEIPAGMDCASAAVDWPETVPIVLMSAGFETDPASDDPYVALSTKSWRRLRAAVLLSRSMPEAPLYIAGGGPFVLKESAVLSALARDWGVAPATLHAEDGSTTTWESAFALRSMIGGRVRVVSSALHLPRSLIAFQAAGFQACGQPSDSDYQGPGGLGYYLPQRSGLRRSEMAIYELLGQVLYRYRANGLVPAVPAGQAGVVTPPRVSAAPGLRQGVLQKGRPPARCRRRPAPCG